MNNIQKKGMWKRTLSLLGAFRIPWHLYVVSMLLSILSTKIALLYIPYLSSMQTGALDSETLRGYFLFAALNSVTSLVCAVPTFYASYIVTRNLQKKMIGHALRLPLASYERNSSDIVSWITSDCGSVDGLIGVLTSFITSIATLIMSTSSIGELDKSMVALVPVVILMMLFFTWLEGKLLFLRQKKDKIARSELTAYFSEHLSYLLQIKQLHADADELKRSKASIRKYFGAEVYQMLLTLLNACTSGSMTNMIAIMVFVFGVPLVRAGKFDLAGLAAFQNYIMIAYSSVSAIPSTYTNMMYQNGELYYIGGMMAEKEEVVRRSLSMDREDEDICLEHVDFCYDADSKVLNDVSLTIPKGKVTMLVGPNGSGKSTIFKLLERFYTPTSGRVRFGSVDAEDIHLDEWRESIAYVLQEPQLFNGTIRENITYGMSRPVTQEEIEAAAKLACADEFIREFPEGYDFEIGDNGCRLSGGQKQRIAIARAVMLDPAYLLLDEATCSMDVYSESAVTTAILRLMKNRTTVMISHDMHMLKNADHVIVLGGGKVEAEGTPEEVRGVSTTLQAMLAGAGMDA